MGMTFRKLFSQLARPTSSSSLHAVLSPISHQLCDGPPSFSALPETLMTPKQSSAEAFLVLEQTFELISGQQKAMMVIICQHPISFAAAHPTFSSLVSHLSFALAFRPFFVPELSPFAIECGWLLPAQGPGACGTIYGDASRPQSRACTALDPPCHGSLYPQRRNGPDDGQYPLNREGNGCAQACPWHRHGLCPVLSL